MRDPRHMNDSRDARRVRAEGRRLILDQLDDAARDARMAAVTDDSGDQRPSWAELVDGCCDDDGETTP